jgi:sulfoxide reductase heme-binding subunit YedZ
VKGDPTFWILARSTGLAAFALLTASVLAGLVVKSRPLASIRPATTVDLHRTLALLALGAVGAHVATLVADHAVEIGVPDVLVPGLAPYRPLWTGLGVAAAELMVAVYASFSLRRRIGQKNWRRLHWATYALFALAAAHGVMTGSDTGRPWAFSLYLGSIGTVVAATAWRFLVPPARPKPRHRPQPATTTEGA